MRFGDENWISPKDSGLLKQEWMALQERISPDQRRCLSNIVQETTEDLVRRFYHSLDQDPSSAEFLSEELIRNKLSKTLASWLGELFPPMVALGYEDMETRQLQVGAIHARINLPSKLVSRGLRILMDGTLSAILKMAPEDYVAKLQSYACNTLSIAVELMDAAYALQTGLTQRNEEVFRLLSLGQNMAQERESQRAAIAEWLQDLLFSVATRHDVVQELSPLAESEFGIWFEHRAAVLFAGLGNLDKIEGLILEIDSEVLPRLSKGEHAVDDLSRLQTKVNEIRVHIGECFNAAARIEGGHDPLTRTLNRRFLDSILTREVVFARRNNRSLSLIMLDIDHFKQVNDTYGHPSGDAVLRGCADIILENTRIGDFVIRYGGEEFLIVMVEADREAAFSCAERIRTKIEDHPISMPDGLTLKVTASIGITEFSGEPDYARLIEEADTALYRAKEAGRNRIKVYQE